MRISLDKGVLLIIISCYRHTAG